MVAQVWKMFKLAEDWIVKDFLTSVTQLCHVTSLPSHIHTCFSPNSREIGPCIIQIITQNLHRLLCYLCTGELNILDRDCSQFQTTGAETEASLSTLKRREQRMPSSLRRKGSQHWHFFFFFLQFNSQQRDIFGMASEFKE